MNEFIDYRPELFELPENLREWVGGKTLLDLALDAVATVQSEDPISTGSVPAGLPRVLLTLLTYCYASGLYQSDDIERQILTDADLRYLSANFPVSADELRRLRRAHRGALQRSLERLLQSAWRVQFQGDLDATSTLLNAQTGVIFQLAAKRRIDSAVLQDSLALDT